MNTTKTKVTNKGRPIFGLPLFVTFLIITLNLQAQYHVAWTRTYNETYNLLFYPAQTTDGFLFSNFDTEGVKIVKLNTKGKLIFSKEANTVTDNLAVAYRDFFPSTKGQLFHEGYGGFYQNTDNSICLKKTDNNYNTLGFGGFVNTYKKPTSFLTSSGHFEFADSSVGIIELANIEKWELEYHDLPSMIKMEN